MGRRYCFHLFYPIDRLSAAIDGVNSIRSVGRRKRDGTPRKWSRDNLTLAKMGHLSSDSPVFLELSLVFPADDRVRAYYPRNDVDSEWNDEGVELLPVGLIDLAIMVGVKYALLTVEARTGWMSELFGDSAAVWGQFTHLLFSEGGLAGYFDDQLERGLISYPLLPDGRVVVELDFFEFVLEERDTYWHLDTDRFTTAVLHNPRIPVPQGRLLR
jgi:hypothetical protein